MVFEKLHAAETTVIGEKEERSHEIQRQPDGCELLDQSALLFAEESQNQNRAQRRQPDNDGENVMSKHVRSSYFGIRSPRVSKGN